MTTRARRLGNIVFTIANHVETVLLRGAIRQIRSPIIRTDVVVMTHLVSIESRANEGRSHQVMNQRHPSFTGAIV